MVRIVATSDCHGMLQPGMLPRGDILVLAGDICRNYVNSHQFLYENQRDSLMQKMYLRGLDEMLSKLGYKQIVAIAGNHDWVFALDPTVRDAIPHIRYLYGESAEFEGIKFWGGPWTRNYNDWAFQFPRPDEERLAECWEGIPEGTDVVITHSPPIGILDLTRRASNKGCPALRERVRQVKPKLHIFGHVHEAYGREEHEGTCFANVALNTRDLEPTNPVQVFDI